MSIRTGIGRIALSLGRFAYKNSITRKIYNGAANVFSAYAGPASSVLTPDNPYIIGLIRSKLKSEFDVKKSTRAQVGDFFRGILLKNDPPVEFYSRTSFTVFIHSPTRCAVGEQWKYQRKGTKEILANVKELASARSIELTRKETSFFKSALLSKLPESFIGTLLRYPEENWTDRSFAVSLNCIRQSDDVKEYVLTDKVVNEINLLLYLTSHS